jgi:predicted permease
MRARAWFRRRRTEDITTEIESHLAMAIRERVDRGEPPDEARAAALREFGNVALVQQTTREVWSWTRVEQLLQDLRFGARILRQAPGLSATAIVLVGLVIGGNTTIYSMVNGLLVSPAAGVTAERLVGIKHLEPGIAIPDPFISYPNYEDYARESSTIVGLAGWSDERMTLGTDSGNYAVFGAFVTANYFSTLGVRVAVGRDFSPGDEDARDGVVAVISDRIWDERFGRDPNVVGRSVRINNVAATVIGVAVPGFAGAIMTPGEEIWVPLTAYYRATGNIEVLANRQQPLLILIGQRAPRASVDDVRAEFDAIAAQIRATYPNAFTQYGNRGVMTLTNPRVSVTPYSVASLLPFGVMAPYFLAAFSIVTLITLVVVSANVANLMLGRAVVQQRDTAVRQSLGASRMRIVRMLLAEGAAIAVVSWAAASLFGFWTSRLIFQFIEPRPGLTAQIQPDWTLAAYAMALAGLSTLAFTLAPALRTWRQPVLPLLRSGEQGVARGRSRLSNALVVLQLAFSVLLITSAGLAYRSISLLDSGEVGFEADRLLLVTVRAMAQEAFATRPMPTDSAERHAMLARLEHVREHLAQQRGISAVSYSPRRPSGNFRGTDPVRRSPSLSPEQAYVRSVGPHFLNALGLAPLNGRDLTAADRPGSPRTAVINEHLARRLFGDESPLGQRIHIDRHREPYEIVGIAPNALYDGPSHDPTPGFVFTARQQAVDGMLIDMTFYVRYDTSLEAATSIAARALAAADAGLPIVAMETMQSRLAQVAELERQATTMLVVFAIVSLVIAALGQYAVAMFNMRRRTRELGVRLALGASLQRIRTGVMRETLALTVPGVVIGFALSIATATVFRAVLFGITPVDPPTYAGVLALLGLTSVVASFIPAWRAGRVNIIETLRTE